MVRSNRHAIARGVVTTCDEAMTTMSLLHDP
ncbi:MAG: hypothetical protein ACI91Q_002302, partial [Gammaproteobacteria bacterium]